MSFAWAAASENVLPASFLERLVVAVRGLARVAAEVEGVFGLEEEKAQVVALADDRKLVGAAPVVGKRARLLQVATTDRGENWSSATAIDEEDDDQSRQRRSRARPAYGAAWGGPYAPATSHGTQETVASKRSTLVRCPTQSAEFLLLRAAGNGGTDWTGYGRSTGRVAAGVRHSAFSSREPVS